VWIAGIWGFQRSARIRPEFWLTRLSYQVDKICQETEIMARFKEKLCDLNIMVSHMFLALPELAPCIRSKASHENATRPLDRVAFVLPLSALNSGNAQA
jgi:hypothetical protein